MMAGTKLSRAVTRGLAWLGTALPLALCVSVWLMGSSIQWLTLLHQVIGIAVLIWTILRVARRRHRPRLIQLGAHIRTWLTNARAATLMLYALLALQSILAALGHFFASETALGRDITRIHGTNAVLLLVLVGWQIMSELRDRRWLMEPSSL